VITVAGMDPLCDQGKAYAAALAAAGSPVELIEFPGLIHGYFALSLAGPTCAAAVTTTCAAFTTLLDAAR
jgi:acetyl esterase